MLKLGNLKNRNKLCDKQRFNDDSSKRAFSMFELSIVLMIISLLISATVAGRSLIKLAGLNKARAITTKIFENNQDNLVAWYESSLEQSFKIAEIIQDSSLSVWQDLRNSRKSNNLSVIHGASKYKKEAIKNVPAITFSGSSSLRINSFNSGSLIQATIFVVFKTPNVNSYKMTLLGSANNDFAIAVNGPNIELSPSGLVNNGKTIFNDNKPHIITAIVNQQNSKVFIDNYFEEGFNINLANSTISGLVIGCNRNNNQCFSGDIAEVIIFDTPLKSDRRVEIAKYLVAKYS
jgi:prepilin-type N-terminal cleavage/methylation domain-containing protein